MSPSLRLRQGPTGAHVPGREVSCSTFRTAMGYPHAWPESRELCAGIPRGVRQRARVPITHYRRWMLGMTRDAITAAGSTKTWVAPSWLDSGAKLGGGSGARLGWKNGANDVGVLPWLRYRQHRGTFTLKKTVVRAFLNKKGWCK